MVWPFIIIVSDIVSQDISNLCFIKENKPTILFAVFFKMAGAIGKMLFAS